MRDLQGASVVITVESSGIGQGRHHRPIRPKVVRSFNPHQLGQALSGSADPAFHRAGRHA
jgi:hypothetical protein